MQAAQPMCRTYQGSCHCGRVAFELQTANVRCIHDVELSSLKVRLFDGEHREDAAKAFLAR